MREPPNAERDARSPGFALSQADIDEFKQIIHREFRVEMNDHDAWGRVIELLNLYRSLLGPIPEDPEAAQGRSAISHSVETCLPPQILGP